MRFPLSFTTLLLVNLIPIARVYYAGLDIPSILLIYWLENGIIGFYNILKLRRVEAPQSASDLKKYKKTFGLETAPRKITKRFALITFPVHYGLFMLGHGGFLWVILNFIIHKPVITTYGWLILFSCIGLFISHGISYKLNFIGKQEYLRTSVVEQMIQPYKRIMIMHLTIIFGLFIAFAIKDFVIMMIIVKTIIDLISHLKEHRSFG